MGAFDIQSRQWIDWVGGSSVPVTFIWIQPYRENPIQKPNRRVASRQPPSFSLGAKKRMQKKLLSLLSPGFGSSVARFLRKTPVCLRGPGLSVTLTTVYCFLCELDSLRWNTPNAALMGG
jgi:hypothetical protein